MAMMTCRPTRAPCSELCAVVATPPPRQLFHPFRRPAASDRPKPASNRSPRWQQPALVRLPGELPASAALPWRACSVWAQSSAAGHPGSQGTESSVLLGTDSDGASDEHLRGGVTNLACQHASAGVSDVWWNLT